MATKLRSRQQQENSAVVVHIPGRVLYPVKEARQLWGGIAQSSFYKIVNEQNVRLIKLGRRTYVPQYEIKRIARGIDCCVLPALVNVTCGCGSDIPKKRRERIRRRETAA